MAQQATVLPVHNHFWRCLLAGITGGALAGFLVAYLESLFLLHAVGPFWVDFPFFVKALLLYGLAGSMGGVFCSVLFYILFFRRHPLRKIQSWVFFFAFLSACGFALETLLYLMDIHTFRNLQGGWEAAAYVVLLGGIIAAAVLGWTIARLCRLLFQGEIRRRLAKGGLLIIIVLAAFFLDRSFIVSRERPGVEKPAAQGENAPANIIILLADSLRADHLSSYGYPLPTSPGVDRLAREGVLFRACYATSTWTIPTHTSLFTGLYPSAHGNYSLYSSLDPSIPTLAQILAGKGYRTASFFDNKLLGSSYGLARGFQCALGVDNVDKVSLTLSRLLDRLRGRRSMSRTILDVADRWIEYRPARRQPFFMFANFLDTHLPYRPQKPYINDFLRSLPDKGVNVKLAGKFTTDELHTKKSANDLYLKLTAADWRWLERFYDSNVRAMDDRIDSFLARLRRAGLLENTLVIITSDHGELFGEGGLGGHVHSSMHNAGLRIPLIFWMPKRLARQTVEPPVSQADIFPTVLALAGFPGAIPGGVQGRDLFAAPPDRELLTEFWDDISKRFSRSFFAGDFKLVVTPAGKQELYDLKNDPGEKSDLAPFDPQRTSALAGRMENLLRSMPQRKSREDAGKRKEKEKKLRSLGYL